MLKVEGLAVLDPHRLAIINDNDFDVDAIQNPLNPPRRNCLWMVWLHDPLVAR